MSDVTRLLEAPRPATAGPPLTSCPSFTTSCGNSPPHGWRGGAGHTLNPTRWSRGVPAADRRGEPADVGEPPAVRRGGRRAMRRILVDHAAGAAREARRGPRPRALDGLRHPRGSDRLGAGGRRPGPARGARPGAAEIVRLKVFGGVSVEEAAELLGVSRASAYRDWAFARAWLRDAISHLGQKNEKS